MPYVNVSTNIILVIVGIGLLIFIHELGHFLVAKKIGVRVLAFSLGFRPAIFKKKWGRQSTGFLLFRSEVMSNWPGKARMRKRQDRHGNFHRSLVGQRASVLVAGVVLNAALALIAFCCCIPNWCTLYYFRSRAGYAWMASMGGWNSARR